MAGGGVGGGVEEEQKAAMQRERWFHGPFPSESLDRVLLYDGDFLVRFKEHKRGFVLSLRGHNNLLHHFRLGPAATTGTTTTAKSPFALSSQSRSFSSVKKLVDHYQQTGEAVPVKGPAVGVRLKKAAERGRWEFKRRDVELGTRLGKGAFGDVYEGTVAVKAASQEKAAPLPLDVAVKTWREGNGHGKSLGLEGEALKQLRFQHKNVVRVVGLVVRDEPKMVVSEWMSKGSLLGHLRRSHQSSTVLSLQSVCQDVSRGMAYLEGLNCVHHAVAARHVLLNSQMVAKVLAPSYSDSAKYKLLMGKLAIKWMAPESMRSGQFTTKSDVWSFGVLTWEVYSFGADPWSGLECDEIRKRVLVMGSRLPPPATAPAAVLGLMGNCWHAEPDARPSFAHIAATIATVPRSLRPL